MAEPLKPWIAPYLIDIAEVYGADLGVVKLATQSHRGQIIRFLTDPSKEGAVWGMLSDGEYSLPIKLANDAAEDDRVLNEDSMQNCCILIIKKYKVVCSRVPRGNSPGLEPESRLVIDCTAFERTVRRPATILGTPKPITSHPDLKLWSDGLKEDGGAGNVLKQRRLSSSAVAEGTVITVPLVSRVPKLIARSKAHLPTELFVQFLDQIVYNDKDPKTRQVQPAAAAGKTPCSSPEVMIEWEPTPSRNQRPGSPLEALLPSQLLVGDYEMDEDREEDEVGQRPVSYEQPYPTQSRKVPRPPSPKRLPKVGSGMILVPNSDVSMAESSQPSQGAEQRKPLRKALSQRDINCPSQDTYDGDEESVEKVVKRKRKRDEYPWPSIDAERLLAILTEADRRREIIIM